MVTKECPQCEEDSWAETTGQPYLKTIPSQLSQIIPLVASNFKFSVRIQRKFLWNSHLLDKSS